jgi:hypothetical protein
MTRPAFVYQDIDASQLEHLLRRGADRVERRQVEANVRGLDLRESGPDGGERRSGALQVSRSQHDARTRTRELLRDEIADAGIPASHHDRATSLRRKPPRIPGCFGRQGHAGVTGVEFVEAIFWW